MATSLAPLPQQISHMPIPHVRRIRPPRILKGTPSPNSVPQPLERPSEAKEKVWAQGRWRDPSSNSAKSSRTAQTYRVEKALRHVDHGQNIYAYSHIRTNQVVYSLTKVMINKKIMQQLVYHGKKTVPAALRRDHWTPYFSLHFPVNEYGSSAGLLAYHQLRELSLQRQLAPPDDMVIATQEDIDKRAARFNPLDFEDMKKNKQIRLPTVGQLLPKSYRSKKLMNQKTTSVADVAFVLGLQAEGPTPEEAIQLRQDKKAAWWDAVSKKARSRARVNETKKTTAEEKLALIRKLADQRGRGILGIDMDATNRIALERNEFAPSPLESKEVRLLWADLRDAAYAQSWPDTVVHAELAPTPAVGSNKAQMASSNVHVISGVAQSRTSTAPRGASGPKGRGTEGKEDPESTERDVTEADAAEELRAEGIEVEPPRRGLWARVKGVFGR